MSYVFQLTALYLESKYYCSETFVALYGRKAAIKNTIKCLEKH